MTSRACPSAPLATPSGPGRSYRAILQVSMSKSKIVAFIIGLLAVACSKPEPPPVAKKPLMSGVELANFDKSVRPQDDFYRYVIGSWLKTAQIPADKAEWGAFDKLADDSEMRLRAIVEETADRTQKAPGSDEQKVGD